MVRLQAGLHLHPLRFLELIEFIRVLVVDVFAEVFRALELLVAEDALVRRLVPAQVITSAGVTSEGAPQNVP